MKKYVEFTLMCVKVEHHLVKDQNYRDIIVMTWSESTYMSNIKGN